MESGEGRDPERVSRRDLLRKMVGGITRAVGAEAAPLLTPTPVLPVPYVPYTSRPTSRAGESRVKEEQA